MTALVKGAIAAVAVSMLLVAGNAISGVELGHVTELHAAPSDPVASSLHSNGQRWRGELKRANVAVTQSVAGNIWGQRRVRLHFANGGWVEFQPTPLAIAADALPRILAIQFPRAGKG